MVNERPISRTGVSPVGTFMETASFPLSIRKLDTLRIILQRWNWQKAMQAVNGYIWEIG
jgi:hypothetical protein